MQLADNIFSTLLFVAPIIIVWLVGIALALSRRRRYPNQSLMLIVAFGLLIGSTLIGSLGPLFAIALGRDSPVSVATVVAGVGLFTTLLSLVSWVLILVAIF